MTPESASPSEPGAPRLHVVVTGGSRGIGRAIVDKFRADGACVTSISRTADGPNALQADLSDPESRSALIGKLVDQPVDVLVNNAGRFAAGGVNADARARAVFELNYWAPIALTRALLPQLKQRKGCVINMSSVNAQLSSAGAGDYCSAKAALDMATRCLAKELAPVGVRINAVSPGPVPTDLLKEAVGPDGMGWMAEQIPLKRLGGVEDIAEAVAWLACRKAGWVTGTRLTLDGGLSC